MTLIHNPAIAQSKHELALALDEGKIKCTKYTLLDVNEREFVKLVVFGNYKPVDAMRTIKPNIKNPWQAAQRMGAREDVIAVINELAEKKNELWLQELRNEKHLSMRKMAHIRNTTADEVVALAAADKLWARANDEIKNNTKQEDQVVGYKFIIDMAPTPEHLKNFKPTDLVIPADYEEVEPKDGKKIDNGLPYEFSYGNESRKNYNEK